MKYLLVILSVFWGWNNFAISAELSRSNVSKVPKVEKEASAKKSPLKVNAQTPKPVKKIDPSEIEKYFSQFDKADVITIGVATGFNNLAAKRATEQKAGNSWKLAPNSCWVRLSKTVYAAEAAAKKGEKKASESGSIGDGSVEVMPRPIYFSIQKKLNPEQHLIFLAADDWQDNSNDCPRPSYLAVNSQDLYKVMQAAERSIEKSQADAARENKRDLAQTAQKITGLLNGQLQKRDPSAAASAKDAYNRAVVSTQASRKKASGYVDEIGTAVHEFYSPDENNSAR